MQCPNCANDNEAGAKFCTACGRKLSELAYVNDAPSAEERGGVTIPPFSMPPAPMRTNSANEDVQAAEDVPEIEALAESAPAVEVIVSNFEIETAVQPDEKTGFAASAEMERGFEPRVENVPPQYPDFSRAEHDNGNFAPIEPARPQWVRQDGESPQYSAPPYTPSQVNAPSYSSIPPYGGTQSSTPPRYNSPQYLPQTPSSYPHQGSAPYPPYGAAPIGGKKKRGVVVGIVIACVIVLIAGITLAYSNFGAVINLGNVTLKGFDDYEDLMKAYFVAFERDDVEAVTGYFLPDIVDDAKREGYDSDDVVYYRDYWCDDYGQKIVRWEITGTSDISVDDIYLGGVDIDLSKVTSVKSIEVEVLIIGDSDVWIFDFDIAMSGGKWYLVEVW